MYVAFSYITEGKGRTRRLVVTQLRAGRTGLDRFVYVSASDCALRGKERAVQARTSSVYSRAVSCCCAGLDELPLAISLPVL